LHANHSFAIDERDVGHEGTDHETELHEVHGVHLGGNSDGKGRLKLPDEEGKVGFGIDGRFQNFETFWSKLPLNATQNLSGFLAMRSSGEDESQAQNFAAVAGDKRLFIVRELYAKFGRFAWKVGGKGGAEERKRG
jgi:hypothetical protein